MHIFVIIATLAPTRESESVCVVTPDAYRAVYGEEPTEASSTGVGSRAVFGWREQDGVVEHFATDNSERVFIGDSVLVHDEIHINPCHTWYVRTTFGCLAVVPAEKAVVHRTDVETTFQQECVRGQHGRRQGQGQGSSRPRPRPRKFVLEVYSRSRLVLEDPHTWAFFTARRYAESGYAKSSVCPSLSNSTLYCHLLCACV